MVGPPAIYRCTVWHGRRERIRTGFRYAYDLWLVDVDDPPVLPRSLRWLGRLSAADHLGDPGRTIAENVRCWLRRQGVELAGCRIMMLTAPRFLGRFYNPLTLFWCLAPDGSTRCVVAEVYNTYRDRHCYLLRPDAAGRTTVDKDFYVSPFLAMGGRYHLRVAVPGDEVHVTIALRQGDRTPFAASLSGHRQPLTWRSVFGCVLRHPLGSYRVSALIRYQGIKLFLRRVPVLRRPAHRPQIGV